MRDQRAKRGGAVPGWSWRLLALLAVVLLAALPAPAAEIKLAEGAQPVTLIADTITYDANTGRLTAEGSVEVYYGQRTLTARRIVYDDRTGLISADGPLVLRDPTGATVFADAAELDAELREGLVTGARSVMGQNVRLAAAEARRIDGRYNTLSKAVYSPCKVCPEDPTPLWRIRARRVIHDEEERVIHYENATFEVLGVPVAWLPYFRHPDPTVKRASGFLVPRFVSSTTIGYGGKLPYYLVIDDHSDFTVTPFFTTNDGLILEGEYRRAFAAGEMRIAGSVTRGNYTGNERVHGHLDTEGRFAAFEGVTWGWDVTLASDDGYLSRYEYPYGDRLTSELFVESYGPNGFFDLAGVRFQSLRDDEPAGTIPLALPVFDARRDLGDPWLGGNFGLFASGHALNRTDGRDAARLTLGADWEREAILPVGLALTGFAEVRGDLFAVEDDPAIAEDVTGRFTALAGIEARFPLVSDSYDGVTHLIEPIVQIIAAPYGGNDARIPVEDSLVVEFDETNVIDRNHFSGLDSYEEGPRLNLALRYERIADDGLKFDASIGQVFRLRDIPAFSAGSGLRDPQSDIVAAWGAEYDPYVRVRHRIRFSDDAAVTRNEVFGGVTIDPVELSVGYVFFESDPLVGAVTDREEVDAEAKLRLDRNWSVGAFMRRDLQLGEFVQVGGSLRYRNECCTVDLFLKRRFTDSTDSPASTSVGVQVELLTLGDTNER